MHPMDTWAHLNRAIKIKWWTLTDACSSHTIWHNLSASSSIEQTWPNDENLRTCVQSEPLIKDEETHSMVTPKFLYKLTCSSTKNFIFGFFKQIKLFRQLSPWISSFLPLLDFFLHPRSVWNQDFVERTRGNHLLNAKLGLLNHGLKILWYGD